MVIFWSNFSLRADLVILQDAFKFLFPTVMFRGALRLHAYFSVIYWLSAASPVKCGEIYDEQMNIL